MLGLERSRILVAVSGGRDSAALLHLLRFATDLPVAAAHFDHAMRSNSADDARWVAGLCAAWRVPLHTARHTRPLRTETEARRERFRFLHSAAEAAGAEHIALAHHADDQAETVLFRAVRGTGIRGLSAMAPAGPGPLVRPLLGFWRREIAAYAREAGLRWREDFSNRDLARARNRLRHDVLPRLERTVAPGARRSLVRLAQHAREHETALEAALDRLLPGLHTSGGAGLPRAVFREQPELAPLLLRRVLRPFGLAPDAVGTRLAVQFITESPSGRIFQLEDGVQIRAEFDRVRVERAAGAAETDRPLMIEGHCGAGVALIGGRSLSVSWRLGFPDASAPEEQAFAYAELRGPLELRAPMPGDRIRLAGGTRALKKLWNDCRVPRSRRRSTPVLVDGAGKLLWVVGVARSVLLAPRPGEDALLIRVSDD